MYLFKTKRTSSIFCRLTALILSVLLVFLDCSAYARQPVTSQRVSGLAGKPKYPYTRTPAAPDLSGFTLPETIGRIESFHPGTSGRTVIYIQDAHDSLEAQENIAKIIEHAVSHYGVHTVFEEGYEGKVPADDYFGFIRDPEMRRKFSYFLMDQLRLGGAEYSYINRQSAKSIEQRVKTKDEHSALSPMPYADFQLIGADNIHAHLQNIRAYQEFSKIQPVVLQDLNALLEKIKILADQKFPAPLKEWIKLKERFSEGTIGLMDYLQRTSQQSTADSRQKHKDLNRGLWTVDRGQYPSLTLILSAQKSKDPAILQKIQDLDGGRITEELELFEAEIVKSLSPSGRGQGEGGIITKIFKSYEKILLLQKLARFKLTSTEYEKARNVLKDLKTAELAQFIAQESGKPVVLSRLWESAIPEAVKFYELARERDRAIEKALKEEGREKKEEKAGTTGQVLPSSISHLPSVLVFGGFHSESIQKILRERGDSYYVVTPRISSPSKRHEDYYKRLMSVGRHPYEITLGIVPHATVAERALEEMSRAELRTLFQRFEPFANLSPDLAARQLSLEVHRSEVRTASVPVPPVSGLTSESDTLVTGTEVSAPDEWFEKYMTVITDYFSKSFPRLTSKEKEAWRDFMIKLIAYEAPLNIAAKMIESRIKETGRNVFDIEALLNRTPNQKDLFQSGEPYEFDSGSVYHLVYDLDEILKNREVPAPVNVTRGPHQWGIFVFEKNVRNPGILRIDTEVFNRFLHRNKAVVNRKSGEMALYENLQLSEVLEIWVSEDTFDRYLKILDPEHGAAADPVFKEQLSNLWNQKKIHVIPGLHHLKLPEDSMLRFETLWKRIGAYLIERNLLRAIPAFRRRSEIGSPRSEMRSTKTAAVETAEEGIGKRGFLARSLAVALGGSLSPNEINHRNNDGENKEKINDRRGNLFTHSKFLKLRDVIVLFILSIQPQALIKTIVTRISEILRDQSAVNPAQENNAFIELLAGMFLQSREIRKYFSRLHKNLKKWVTPFEHLPFFKTILVKIAQPPSHRSEVRSLIEEQKLTDTSLRGKKVAITGAAGNIGSVLSDQVGHSGASSISMLVLANESGDFIRYRFKNNGDVTPGLIENPTFEHRLEIGRLPNEIVQRALVKGNNIIFHLADLPLNGGNNTVPLAELLTTDSLAAAFFINAAEKKEEKPRIVYTSSIEVYGLIRPQDRGDKFKVGYQLKESDICDVMLDPVLNRWINRTADFLSKSFNAVEKNLFLKKDEHANRKTTLEKMQAFLNQFPPPEDYRSMPRALSKIVSERLLNRYNHLFHNAVIVRLAGVYGPGYDAPYRDFKGNPIHHYLHLAQEGDEIPYFVGKKQFIYVGDVVESLIRAATISLEKFGDSPAVLNVGSDQLYTGEELAKAVLKTSAKSGHTVPGIPSQNHLLMNLTKMKNVLGIEKLTSLESGLAETWHWLTESGDVPNSWHNRFFSSDRQLPKPTVKKIKQFRDEILKLRRRSLAVQKELQKLRDEKAWNRGHVPPIVVALWILAAWIYWGLIPYFHQPALKLFSILILGGSLAYLMKAVRPYTISEKKLEEQIQGYESERRKLKNLIFSWIEKPRFSEKAPFEFSDDEIPELRRVEKALAKIHEQKQIDFEEPANLIQEFQHKLVGFENALVAYQTNQLLRMSEDHRTIATELEGRLMRVYSAAEELAFNTAEFLADGAKDRELLETIYRQNLGHLDSALLDFLEQLPGEYHSEENRSSPRSEVRQSIAGFGLRHNEDGGVSDILPTTLQRPNQYTVRKESEEWRRTFYFFSPFWLGYITAAIININKTANAADKAPGGLSFENNPLASAKGIISFHVSKRVRDIISRLSGVKKIINFFITPRSLSANIYSRYIYFINNYFYQRFEQARSEGRSEVRSRSWGDKKKRRESDGGNIDRDRWSAKEVQGQPPQAATGQDNGGQSQYGESYSAVLGDLRRAQRALNSRGIQPALDALRYLQDWESGKLHDLPSIIQASGRTYKNFPSAIIIGHLTKRNLSELIDVIVLLFLSIKPEILIRGIVNSITEILRSQSSAKDTPGYIALAGLLAKMVDKAGQLKERFPGLSEQIISWQKGSAINRVVKTSLKEADDPRTDKRSEVRSKSGAPVDFSHFKEMIGMDEKAIHRRLNEIRSEAQVEKINIPFNFLTDSEQPDLTKIISKITEKEFLFGKLAALILGTDKKLYLAAETSSPEKKLGFFRLDPQGDLEEVSLGQGLDAPQLEQLVQVQEGLQYRRLLEAMTAFQLVPFQPSLYLDQVAFLQNGQQLFFQFALDDLSRLEKGKSLFTSEEIVRGFLYRSHGTALEQAHLMSVLRDLGKKHKLVAPLSDPNHPLWLFLNEVYKAQRVLAALDANLDPDVPSLPYPEPLTTAETLLELRKRTLLIMRYFNAVGDTDKSQPGLLHNFQIDTQPKSPFLAWINLSCGARPLLQSEGALAEVLKDVEHIEFIPSVQADPSGDKLHPGIMFPPRLRLIFNRTQQAALVDPPAERLGDVSKPLPYHELTVAILDRPILDFSDTAQLPNLITDDEKVKAYAFTEGLDAAAKVERLRKLLEDIALQGLLLPESRQLISSYQGMQAFAEIMARTPGEKQAVIAQRQQNLAELSRTHSKYYQGAPRARKEILRDFDAAAPEILRKFKLTALRQTLMAVSGLDANKNYPGLEGRWKFFEDFPLATDYFLPVLSLLLLPRKENNGKSNEPFLLTDAKVLRSKIGPLYPKLQKAEALLSKLSRSILEEGGQEASVKWRTALNLTLMIYLGMDSDAVFSKSNPTEVRDALDRGFSDHLLNRQASPAFYQDWHNAVRDFESLRNLNEMENKMEELASRRFERKILPQLSEAFQAYERQVLRLIELDQIRQKNTPPALNATSEQDFMKSIEAVAVWANTPRSEVSSVPEAFQKKLGRYRKLLDFRNALESGASQDSRTAYDRLRDDFVNLRSPLHALCESHRAAKPPQPQKLGLFERLLKEWPGGARAIPTERIKLFAIDEKSRDIYLPFLSLFIAMLPNSARALISHSDFGRFTSGTQAFPPISEILAIIIPASERIQARLNSISGDDDRNRFLITLNVTLFKKMGLGGGEPLMIDGGNVAAVRQKFMEFLQERFDPENKWPNVYDEVKISGEGRLETSAGSEKFVITVPAWNSTEEYTRIIDFIAGILSQGETLLSVQPDASIQQTQQKQRKDLIRLLNEAEKLADVREKKNKLYEAGEIYKEMWNGISPEMRPNFRDFSRSKINPTDLAQRETELNSFFYAVERRINRQEFSDARVKLDAAKVQPLFPGMDDGILRINELEALIKTAELTAAAEQEKATLAEGNLKVQRQLLDSLHTLLDGIDAQLRDGVIHENLEAELGRADTAWQQITEPVLSERVGQQRAWGERLKQTAARIQEDKEAQARERLKTQRTTLELIDTAMDSLQQALHSKSVPKKMETDITQAEQGWALITEPDLVDRVNRQKKGFQALKQMAADIQKAKGQAAPSTPQKVLSPEVRVEALRIMNLAKQRGEWNSLDGSTKNAITKLAAGNVLTGGEEKRFHKFEPRQEVTLVDKDIQTLSQSPGLRGESNERSELRSEVRSELRTADWNFQLGGNVRFADAEEARQSKAPHVFLTQAEVETLIPAFRFEHQTILDENNPDRFLVRITVPKDKTKKEKGYLDVLRLELFSDPENPKRLMLGHDALWTLVRQEAEELRFIRNFQAELSEFKSPTTGSRKKFIERLKEWAAARGFESIGVYALTKNENGLLGQGYAFDGERRHESTRERLMIKTLPRSEVRKSLSGSPASVYRSAQIRQDFEQMENARTPAIIYFSANLLNRSELRDSALAAISQTKEFNLRWVITNSEILSLNLRRAFSRSNVLFAGNSSEARRLYSKSGGKEVELVTAETLRFAQSDKRWVPVLMDEHGLMFFGVIFFLNEKFVDAFRKNNGVVEMFSPDLGRMLENLRTQFTVASAA
ncbi:MAG: NAD-dependent epimerase/dehydratase family protein [Candidatus Omnitrophica bacterium]|nr:NAD-dependent epimerase/dehydratase family protein [Candidatus Omnitrophota bacterium]